MADRTVTLLVTIEAEYRVNGRWPLTFGRLHDLAGFPSRSTTHRHLHALIDAGHVEQSPLEFGGFRPTFLRASPE